MFCVVSYVAPASKVNVFSSLVYSQLPVCSTPENATDLGCVNQDINQGFVDGVGVWRFRLPQLVGR